MIPLEAYNAATLLDSMRPAVEKLLEEHCRPMFGKTMPSCSSQSHRAHRAVQLLDDRIKQSLSIGAPYDAVSFLYDIRKQLEDFLAVHRTIELLEHTYNNKQL